MANLPSGTVTFLFTDIEGSTQLWERDRGAMAAAVERHLALLRGAVEGNGGVLFKVVGDAVQVAFPTAPQAVAATLDAQRALLSDEWDEVDSFRVRMAVHAGEAMPDARGDYLAAPLNRLSRLLGAGYGGQVLVSQAVQQLARGAMPDGAELLDLGEHRLRDLLEPEQVFQLLHPDLPREFPPLRSLDARPNNLPTQPTPFLGREAELSEVIEFLRRPDVRLLTVSGPGGTGKTRLAVQAAAELADEFADGVFFVDLAPLGDPALVASAVAGALGVGEAGDRPLVERLRAFLAARSLLLVLDNFEHLIEAAPLAADLVAAGQRVKALVTSRTPLRVRAEQEYPAPPLGLPRRTPPPTAEQLAQYDAVRLFVARARAVKPGFAVDDESAPAVAEICRRLDGLPLAIELAAARIRLLPPQALLARLGQRLALLTAGPRDAPERQRTLRNTIAWSHDLLSQEEQAVFRRLAVFAGGCALEAAEAVADPGGQGDVFAGLTTLVEENLLRQEAGPQGEPRFRMLETIREYGLEQLAQSGEEEAIRDRQAAWLLDRAREAARVLQWRYAADHVERLDADYANLVGALEWLWSTGRGQQLLELTGALGDLWYLTGRHREGREWAERALGAGPVAPTSERAWTLQTAGRLAQSLGDVAAATARLEEARSLFGELGLPVGEGTTAVGLGIVDEDRGAYDAAEPRFLAARELFRQAGDDIGVAVATYHLAIVAYGRNERGRARELWEGAEADLRAHNDSVAIAWCRSYLALLATEDGELRRAADALREAAAFSRAVALRHHQDQVLGVASVLSAACGLNEAAARLQGAAHALNDNWNRQLPEGLAFRRTERRLRGALGDGGYARAWQAGRAYRPEEVEAVVETVLKAASTGDH